MSQLEAAMKRQITMQETAPSTQSMSLFAASAAATASSLAKPSRAKGPCIWLDMDQQELDNAYDQLVYAPNRDQVGKRRIVNSERAREILGPPQRVSYGSTEIEKLDIFRARKANAPINIFVHGGAWRANRASDYAFLAEPLVDA